MKQMLRFLALALTFLLLSCNNKSQTSETDNLYRFKDYISFNTYGNISIAEPVRIVLNKSLDDFELTQELDSDYLKISPKTPGTLVVENSNTLVFTPKKYFDPNTEYTLTLDLNKLFDGVDSDFRSYTFSFMTIAPEFKIRTGELQSYSKEWQYVTGSMEVSDVIALEDARNLIRASKDDKEISINWEDTDEYARYFNFILDSISRGVEDGILEIAWDGKEIGSDFKGGDVLEIPGRDNFKVIDISTQISPQSSLSINFSDPVDENQDFTGLIDIEGVEEFRTDVEGNLLTLYPSSRVVGEVLVTVFTGIKNSDNFKLKNQFSERVSFETLKPEIRLLSKGTILPRTGSTPLYFEAVNLSAVDVRIIEVYEDNMLQFLQSYNLNSTYTYDLKLVGRRIARKTIQLEDKNLGSNGEWKAYGINLSEYFDANPGSLYRIEMSFGASQVMYACDDLISDEDGYEEEYDEYEEYVSNEALEDEDAREEQYWDNEIYNYRRFSYNWQQRDNPCHPAYYNEDRIISTNVLGSDLGMIAKKGNNRSYHFAVTNLLSTSPESGASVKLYNFQQQLLGEAETDANGLAIFDSEKNIAFAIAKKGSNYAYLKLEDGNALSLSNFDVAGKQLQKGIKGFLYTERGVHRPGDSIHLNFVLNDNANRLPDNHPVRMELADARGKLVQRTVLNRGEDGFYYFPITTDPNAPSGNWTATVSVGGARFSKTLRVATIKPNRLKIALDFDDEVLDASKAVTGNVQVNWLHGAPARNLKIEMDMTLRSSNEGFKGFPNYQFQDPVRTFDETELSVVRSALSDQGYIQMNKKFAISKKAPGMLRATFLTKVFEGGGDFSIDVFSKNLAPFDHFVGLRSPEPHRYGSYDTGRDTEFNLVSVNAQGEARGNRKLQAKVFKIEWRWWWNRGYDNLSRYENSVVHRPVLERELITDSSGKALLKINIPEEEGGRYLIRVIDPESGHATGRVTYFYRNWWSRPTDGDAESSRMLIFNSDKENYEVGDQAVITFPSGGNGRALISIENGTEVLSTQWVETIKGETQVRIPITAEMAPNVFVNISLLQPHEQTQNDNPIRLYGVVPVMVEDPATRLKPVIEMPDQLRPESEYTVEIKEENNRPMTYTIAVVDEGLLDLTRFPTPKIHEAFYTREALGVRTFDIFDDVIGAYSGSVDNIYAIGGGDAGAAAKNRKADRFKPVVQYLGPFRLEAGKTASHQLKMPNYVGSVRTMVVAGDKASNAYGKTDATTPVRKPLMVLASLPRKLSPGEKVTLPVTVFAMEPGIRNVDVSVKTGEGLLPIGQKTKQVTFSEVGEKMVNFEFEVRSVTGIQTVEISASGHGENSSFKVEIDVENPNPITRTSRTIRLNGKSTKDISFDTFGEAGSNSASLEFSTLPPMDFNKRMEYLVSYPHGCIEQTTSSAFPQLYLADIFDLTSETKNRSENNIKAAIERLSSFQTTEGGLSYWPGERSSDPWGTNYAGHFMLEAKEKGYAMPISFLSNWINYQKKAARSWRNRDTRYNSGLEQAYRLYTLALAGHPEMAAMNRLRESKNLSNDAKWRLAAAYSLAGKNKVAAELAASAAISFERNESNRYTYGSPFRNKAMALETMVILENEDQRDLAESLAKELSSEKWFSTQETAYALLALGKMVSKNGGRSLDLSYAMANNSYNVSSSRSLAQRDIDVNKGTNEVTVTNDNDNVLYVTLSLQGRLPLGQELQEKRGISLKLQYYDGNGDKLEVDQLRQGTEINARAVITNMSDDNLTEMALSQIFPSGWEIVNTSFTELEGGASGKARYTDIRDDRVNFYFDLKAKKSKTFDVTLNASYLGTYYLPGAQCEAMYDNKFYVRNKGKWIEVVQ